MLGTVSGSAPAIIVALIAGVAGSIQVAVSGALGRRIGVLDAAAFGSAVGAVLLVTTALAVRNGDGIWAAWRAPWWMWLSGVMGAIIVGGITYAPTHIGVFATIGLLIAGQLVMGALIDAFGIFGVEKIPLDAVRITGLALLSVGAVLVLQR
jgi:bacterial/archaeal transporter family-2 protein